MRNYVVGGDADNFAPSGTVMMTRDSADYKYEIYYEGPTDDGWVAVSGVECSRGHCRDIFKEGSRDLQIGTPITVGPWCFIVHSGDGVINFHVVSDNVPYYRMSTRGM